MKKEKRQKRRRIGDAHEADATAVDLESTGLWWTIAGGTGQLGLADLLPDERRRAVAALAAKRLKARADRETRRVVTVLARGPPRNGGERERVRRDATE